MKKFLLFAFVIVVFSVFFLLSSCNKSSVLRIYNWADYIPEEVIQQFEKEYNCKVIYDTYASNEEMFAKIKSGGTGYDIVFPSGDHVKMMINEGLLEKLDLSKIPNFKNIDPIVLSKTTYDPNHEYSVPYMMGATGLIVNKKYLKDYEKSWSIYERADLKGKMTLLDDMREVFGAALKYLGYSVNTTNPDEIEQAKQVILKWKENIVKFDATTYAQGVVNGEFWVVHGYPENVFQLIPEEDLENFEFFVPKEGGTLWIDNMVILKDAKNKDLAYKFINFILRPEIAAQISDYLMIPSPITDAQKYKKVEPLYTLDELGNCEIIDYIGEHIDLYNKAWEEIIK
ncbi:spermidine/putrescine-binding periplasmic protein [Fervidobacterium pennivorans DSM 9078]|uniref:Spermidine/putrescine-binding periplasmic protein n=1 Tax=Fervidobacterium pennivorans (strain DSM 9078 / Ven5) TaxID=771875 RepID=H9UE12_FERPD|nr:extracellular solute-binding protein [Fervidobacterium pennivorans]AFG35755.1 spermidine/putrescine-binding periplasmic protein [Fervidobacterium pennivorans DSM 9078]